MTRAREKLREALAEMLQDSFERDSFDRADARPRETEAGLRHFSAREQELLTPAARGYLLNLTRSRQLGRVPMELIIQYVSLFWEAPVDIGDLEDLLDQVVFGLPPADLDDPAAWTGRRRH